LLESGRDCVLKRNSVYLVVICTIIWIILTERYTLVSVSTGIVVSIGCVLFCRKFLPLDSIAGVNFLKLFVYIFYMLGQMYVSAILTIKLILKGAKADIVEIHTDISNEFLRVILANSITLVPGSITLEMREQKITILLLHEKTWGLLELAAASDKVKGGLERKLINMQKRGGRS
jgi:multicomponent Na+:H+ antiporter subunit E